MSPRAIFVAACAAAFLLVASGACAQWKAQSIELRPGWNAIHLEVQPTPSAVEEVFQGLPVESVWYWNGKFSSIQFLADPGSLLADDPHWLPWFPTNTPQSSVNRLFTLRGGGAYLVKLGGAQQQTLNLTGRPVLPRAEWLTDDWSMVGFALDPGAVPTFGEFFASSSAHQGLTSFQRLNAQGVWEAVPASTQMRRGEAFWVKSKGASNFQGSIRIGGVPVAGMDFGRLTSELSIDLTNLTSTDRTVSVRMMGSAPPPAGETAIAGEVPMSWVDFRTDNVSGYEPLNVGDFRTIVVPAKTTRSVRLAVRRGDMAALADGAEAYYQSLVRITDGQGTLLDLPVRALGLNQSETQFTARGFRAGRSTAANPYCGLWVGTVTVNAVSLPANRAAPERTERASNELRFRLLLHVDETGAPRLLKNVTVMSKTDAGETRLVLVTDDSMVDDFDGVFERDGALLGQRISSINFPFFDVSGEPRNTLPSDAGSAFEDGDAATTDTLAFSFPLAYNDPVNPFLHKFHPDHDALNALFQPFPEAEVDITGDGVPDVTFLDINRQTNTDESYTIFREIELAFSGQHPTLQSTPPQWLTTQIGGLYRERIYGLYRTDYTLKDSMGDPAPIRTPLVVSGTFEMVQVSTVAQLNDGM